jgi:hypothetical protein
LLKRKGLIRFATRREGPSPGRNPPLLVDFGQSRIAPSLIKEGQEELRLKMTSAGIRTVLATRAARKVQ